jgi:hypothetical protein
MRVQAAARSIPGNFFFSPGIFLKILKDVLTIQLE